MTRILLLLSAAAAVVFCSACSSLIRQDPPPSGQKKQDGGTAAQPSGKQNPAPLTDKQIAEMSPEELERYMEEKRRKEKARAFSEDLSRRGDYSESERRHMRRNVSRPMQPEEQGSAFPWKNEPGNRSESLRDTTTFNH
jgi:hypothetical protein